MDFGSILDGFLELFFIIFQTPRKMLHPTKVLHIPIKSWVARLAKTAKKHPKMNKKTVWERRRKNYGFLCRLGLILAGFWDHFGGQQKPSENQGRFWDAFLRLAPITEGRRGDVGGTSGGVRRGHFLPKSPLGGALFARGGII